MLSLIAARLTDPKIAARLSLSPRTVSWHLMNVFTKLGVDSRRDAAAVAVRHGLA